MTTSWQMRPGRSQGERGRISNCQGSVSRDAGHFSTGRLDHDYSLAFQKIIIVSTAAMHSPLPLRVISVASMSAGYCSDSYQNVASRRTSKRANNRHLTPGYIATAYKRSDASFSIYPSG